MPRTPARRGDGTAHLGYLHCGPSGAGHFVKMVHNGIEYGFMAAYAERHQHPEGGQCRQAPRAADAETRPAAEPEYYQFDIDLAAVAEVWRHGSVIGSWLLDLTAGALKNRSGAYTDSAAGSRIRAKAAGR